MKILVTGANGYLGKGVVDELLNLGHVVIATDFKSDRIDSRAVVYETDLFSVEEPFEFFEKPDVLLHMAWRDGFIHNSKKHIEDFSSHYKFIEDMVSGGVTHVAVLGSMHEIGFFEGSINEYTPQNPKSLYGISKNALRQAVELLCETNNIIFQWLRGFYIVGATPDGSSIFSKIIQAAQSGQKQFPFTTGMNQYDFVDYSEFSTMVALTVTQVEVDGVINICSGRPKRLAERVEEFIEENGLEIELQYGVFPDRPYDSKAVWGDNRKLNLITNNR